MGRGNQLTRASLAASLIVLAGTITWSATTKDWPGWQGIVLLLSFAVVAVGAASLLFWKRRAGAVLGLVAAFLGLFAALAISFCLCYAPWSAAAIALFIVSGVVFGLAMLELAVLRVRGVIFTTLLLPVLFASNGNMVLLVAGIGVLWLVARLLGHRIP